MKIKKLTLSDSERRELTTGFRTGESHCFRMRCRAILLKAEGLSAPQVGAQTEMTAQTVGSWVKRFESQGIQGLYTRPGQGRKAIMDCSDEEFRAQSHRIGPAECACSQRSLAECFGQGSERIDVQTFFIRIGARYRRIRKRPKGKPSPQLYAYKTEKLQELETLFEKGSIDLFYGDESHICTEGHVPYGWQFAGEDVYIPVEKAKRLNIFGMIDRNNRFEGFCTCDSVDAEKVVDFLDRFSFKLYRKTFVVLDNASVHRNEKIKRMRPIWEKRGLFLFYSPPYSPHLNIVETLWRIMKGKWLRPQDYVTTESLFYATNRALAAIGTRLNINFSHYAA